jgi:hypothetical protein
MWVTTTNQQPINWGPTTSIMPMAGGGGGVTTLQLPAQPVGPRIEYRKKSRFIKALFECGYAKPSNGDLPRDIDTYFRDQTLGGFLPAMGFNPMYNGRPRREILPLLLSAPSPMKFFNQGTYFCFGLVTFEPAVCNRRKTRARLSYAGLELLDYWSEKYPKFKPFVDAYVTKKARKEIAADAVGYRLGIVPSRFAKMLELHAKEEAMNRDTPGRRRYKARREALLASQHLYWSAQQNTAANQPPLWAQQAMQQAMTQQQYNILIGQQMNQNNISLHTPIYTGGTSATDATAARTTLGLGSAIGRLLGRK